MQYVGDNTDHDIATTNDENTHQGLGSIAIAGGKFSNLDTRQTPLPREKNIDGLKIESTQDISIKEYFAPDRPVLNQIVLHPVVEVQFKASFVNPFWSCSGVFLERRASGSGYMSVNADGQPLGKSVLINLSAVNRQLCFVVKQSKNEQKQYVHKQYADLTQQRRKGEPQHSFMTLFNTRAYNTRTNNNIPLFSGKHDFFRKSFFPSTAIE